MNKTHQRVLTAALGALATLALPLAAAAAAPASSDAVREAIHAGHARLETLRSRAQELTPAEALDVSHVLEELSRAELALSRGDHEHALRAAAKADRLLDKEIDKLAKLSPPDARAVLDHARAAVRELRARGERLGGVEAERSFAGRLRPLELELAHAARELERGRDDRAARLAIKVTRRATKELDRITADARERR